MRKSKGSYAINKRPKVKTIPRKNASKNVKKTRKNSVDKNNGISLFSQANNTNLNHISKSTPRRNNRNHIKIVDPRLSNLSQNFDLFLLERELKSFLLKRIKTIYFKKWRHRFASSVLTRFSMLKNQQKMKSTSNNVSKEIQNQKIFSETKFQQSKSLQNSSQFNKSYSSSPKYNSPMNSQKMNSPKNNSQQMNASKSPTNSQKSEIPITINQTRILNSLSPKSNSNKINQTPPKESSDPRKLIKNVLSPVSPSLVASLSPKIQSDSDSFSLDVFDNNYPRIKQKQRNQSPITNTLPKRQNSYKHDNSPKGKMYFQNTLTEFVPSDEFLSDLDSNIDSKSNIQKDKFQNLPYFKQKEEKEKEKEEKAKEKYFNSKFGSTLPEDLFSSEDERRQKFVSTIFKKEPLSPKKYQNQGIETSKNPSPVRMDEELLIKAALSDEFVSDRSPRHSKRKIIIVREYSDSNPDENSHDEIIIRNSSRDRQNNYLPIDNSVKEDRKPEINYLQTSAPIKRENQNYQSPIKKFTFSDESFTESENENDDFKFPNPYKTMKNDRQNNSTTSLRVSFSEEETSNFNSTFHRTNDGTENHFSSTIEIPKADIGTITLSQHKKSAESYSSNYDSYQYDYSQSEQEYSKRHFLRNNDKLLQNNQSNSSDEIEYLLHEDNKPIKSLFSKESYNDDDF